MIIRFKDNKVEKQCRDIRVARKSFPDNIPKKLHKLIGFIDAAENLKSVINNPTYHFHDLKGNKSELYALDIAGRKSSYRLIISFDEFSKEEVFANSISILSIEIKEVSNHYE